MQYKRLSIFIFLVCLPFGLALAQGKPDKKAAKKEAKADREFVRQKFDKAMKIYESAFNDPLPKDQAALLHLKTARLYLTLLMYPEAVPHYDKAMELQEDLFTTTDICNYLDALRFTGQKIKATGIVMKYAYSNIYHADQRYLNILHALNYEGGFMPLGTPEYSVRRIEALNSINSQFWVGSIRGEHFYAESGSRFHDPNKRFYHRASYLPLNESSIYFNNRARNKKGDILSSIPVYLQNGPISFSSDLSKIIVTEVSYKQGEKINLSKDGPGIFPTKLYLSEYNAKRNGWSAFKEAFPQKEEASYSHPYIFNNDRSILFSSNMTGGYGGFDIYIAHWNDQTGTWGEPINMGPSVNTEGDEIGPSLSDGVLLFASNGHVGFGGYDIYSVSYEGSKVVKGSLHHFDYPINTVMNDFGMLQIDKDRGYIVSDRLRIDKDDIFYFERNRTFMQNNLLMGMHEQRAVSTGAINFSNNGNVTGTTRNVPLPAYTSTELLLSVYFDFDKYHIDRQGMNALDEWLADTDLTRIQSFIIEGYADEMGTELYNMELSRMRAEAISDWLTKQGIRVKMTVSGKGQITVSRSGTEMTPYYIERPVNNIGFNNRILQNHTARRVDIKAVIK